MSILKFLFLVIFTFGNNADATQMRAIKCGWYSWEPYQYIKKKEGINYLIGLDIHILNAVADIAGSEVIYEEISWQ